MMTFPFGNDYTPLLGEGSEALPLHDGEPLSSTALVPSRLFQAWEVCS